jgi:hypothetical protein
MTPLLPAARVRDVIDAIAHDLDRCETGDPFATLFFAYRERAYGGPTLEDRIEKVSDAVAEAALPATLFGGLAGIGWLRAHFALDDESDAELEDLIADALRRGWTGDFDLIGGLVGIGVYALERRARGSTTDLLDTVVDRLAERAQPAAIGACWKTEARFLTPELRTDYPDGWYNLGLAHGIPGVIALLGAAARAGVPHARPLLDRAVDFLLAQQLSGGGFASSCDHRCATRAAWCYGDPGVAIALLSAARDAGEPAWERHALALARLAANRPAEQCGVEDASLCHGTAGLAHIYHRFYLATGEAVFRDAAVAWLERTLADRVPGVGIGGYRYWTGDAWVDNGTLLVGAAGIGLVLLAASTTIEPTWDRLLLCSSPGAAITRAAATRAAPHRARR